MKLTLLLPLVVFLLVVSASAGFFFSLVMDLFLGSFLCMDFYHHTFRNWRSWGFHGNITVTTVGICWFTSCFWLVLLVRLKVVRPIFVTRHWNWRLAKFIMCFMLLATFCYIILQYDSWLHNFRSFTTCLLFNDFSCYTICSYVILVPYCIGCTISAVCFICTC